MKLLPSDKGKRVRFKLSAEPGSQVYVAGTFNNWNPAADQLKSIQDSKNFKIVLRMSPGLHEYKFVVNGVWLLDPECADFVSNACGSMNSVLNV